MIEFWRGPWPLHADGRDEETIKSMAQVDHVVILKFIFNLLP